MQRLNLTLDTAAANLALEEALLETAEITSDYPEVLRIWEPAQPLVVLGRSSPIEKEINLEYCQRHNFEVLRRCSGGASIVSGPGCLMYCLLLDYRKRESLRKLEVAHRFVMDQMRQAIATLNVNVQMQGSSDLTLHNRKFSGNSLRCKKNWLIYHGTLIYDFDLSLIEKCLHTPQRQPDYRQQRNHADFLTQLPLAREPLCDAISHQWAISEEMKTWPEEMTVQLAAAKYATKEWTYKVA